jgi:hypothetical protein
MVSQGMCHADLRELVLMTMANLTGQLAQEYDKHDRLAATCYTDGNVKAAWFGSKRQSI